MEEQGNKGGKIADMSGLVIPTDATSSATVRDVANMGEFDLIGYTENLDVLKSEEFNDIMMTHKHYATTDTTLRKMAAVQPTMLALEVLFPKHVLEHFKRFYQSRFGKLPK